jgi:phosphoglycolate phosphatase-like HAD superfamily hydrolase
VRFIIEFDGVVFDVAEAWYATHAAATQAVGWSRLDQATLWRLIRTKGREADVLSGAKPVKFNEYWAKFDEQLETDDVLAKSVPQEGIGETLSTLARHGSMMLLTLGGNQIARRELLERNGLVRFFSQLVRLNADPRRRPAELRALTAGDPRTIVVAASDALIRSAGSAELISVGVSSGACNATRLHQAGAGLVYKDLSELADSLVAGGYDLVRAGLLPRSLG